MGFLKCERAHAPTRCEVQIESNSSKLNNVELHFGIGRRHKQAWKLSFATSRTVCLHVGLILFVAAMINPINLAAAQELSSNVALASAVSSRHCPVTVRYDVDLGMEQNKTAAPFFVGFISITSNQNVS